MTGFAKYIMLVLWLSLSLSMHGCINSSTQDQRAFPLKPPRNAGIYVIAHRGAHKGIPENSIPAYKKAIELDADFVEVDIRTSSDGHFISIHNSSVDAYVEGITGSVSDLTLSEIRELDIGTKLGPEWEGTQVPTFEEILDLCQGRIGIYLDLKNAPIPALVELIKERGMEKEIVWCLGEKKEMQTLVEYCSDCVLMPDPGNLAEFARILDDFSPFVVAPVWREFSRELVNMSHSAGALVFVDEQDETSWAQALEWGADGIQTDHPAKLIEYLKHRGHRDH
jgi:glycerophosphoryl diester phosphodiesterase